MKSSVDGKSGRVGAPFRAFSLSALVVGGVFGSMALAPLANAQTSTELLLEDPGLTEMTFNQNRADRLSRFPDPDRHPAPLEPGAPDTRAVAEEVLAVYLAALDTAALAGDAAESPDRPGRSSLSRRRPDASASRTDPVVASQVQAAAEVDYASLAGLVGDDPRRAIEDLEKLTEQRPRDGRLWQLLGAAQLAVDNYGQTVGALRLAIENGRDRAVVHQSLGDALLATDQAEAALEQFRQGPDTGRNRLGRATALIQLDRAKEALAQLDAAQRLAPDLEPRIRAVRAGALKLAGRSEEAEREIARGQAMTSDASLRRSYDRIRRSGPPAPRKGSWGYEISLDSGYNDNVALRSDSASGSAPDEADLVFQPSGFIWHQLAETDRTRLAAEAGFQGAVHADRDEFNEVFLDAGLGVDHELTDAWSLEGDVGVEHGNIDGDSFAYIGRIGLGVRWDQADWTGTSLRYSVAYRDFRFPSVEEEDRDGALHRTVLSQSLRVPLEEQALHIIPYAFLSHEDTDGASAENDGWGLGTDLRYRPIDSLEIFAGGGYREYDYENPHIRTGFAFERHDETWHANLGLSYRISERVVLGVRYNYTDKDSNIPPSFSYEQNEVLLTLSLTGP